MDPIVSGEAIVSGVAVSAVGAISSTVVKTLLEGFKNYILGLIEKRKWKEFFKNKKSYFINDDNEQSIIAQLSELCSDDCINNLSQIMKDRNGFVFKKLIENELWRAIGEFNSSNEDKERFVCEFMASLLDYIKDKYPEIYLQYITDEIYSNINLERELIESIEKSISDIREVVESPNELLSILDINMMLVNASKNKLDLSFFESDDQDFVNGFEKSLESQTSIQVSSASRYECLFMVLNELKKIGKETYIVYNKGAWLRLIKEDKFQNKVFIPFFLDEFIPLIPNNITIFVYDLTALAAKSSLIINKRKNSTVREKLIQFGYDHTEANSYLENSHGFFCPLFRRLFNKLSFIKQYEFETDDVKYIFCALLFGQWEESEGDEIFIESVSGLKYDDYVSIVKKYTIGENPILFKYTTYGVTKYSIVSVEDAWFQLLNYIDNRVWKNYIINLPSVLFDVDDKYKDLDNRYANLLAKSNFSSYLKTGVYNSLIVAALEMNNTYITKDINKMLSMSLNSIQNINQWAAISKYITYISEICPDVFLDRLEKEFEPGNDTNFVGLFKLESDVLFGGNYYVNYIWALEQLLTQHKYVYRALNILFKLSDLNFEYKISNSPNKTLQEVFCAWANLSCISNIKKIDVLREFVNKNPNNVKYALDNMPWNNTVIVGSFSRMRYRASDVESEITMSDTMNVYCGYLDICIEQMKRNYSIIPELVKNICQYNTDIILKFFKELEVILKIMPDNDKYSISNAIRRQIYDHRFYSSANWALPEHIIKSYEDCLNSINYNNQIYRYKYLFEEYYDFPLLHPVPFESPKEEHEFIVNNRMKEQEILQGIDSFKKNKCSLKDLISIITSPQTNIGTYISEFTERVFDKSDLIMILDTQKVSAVVENYSRKVRENDIDDYYLLLDVLKDHKYNPESFTKILKLCPIDKRLINYVDEMEEDIKTAYWSSRIFFDENVELSKIIFEHILEYGSESNYIDTLYDMIENLSVENLYLYFIALSNSDFKQVSHFSSMTSFELKQILDRMNKTNLSEEQLNRLAGLELKYWQLLEWDQMHNLNLQIAKTPDLFADIIRLIYKDDNGEFVVDHDKYVSRVYRLYDKVKFCPGSVNGVMDGELFVQWTNSFKEKLIKQNQASLFAHCMGRLCCYSPINEDSLPLANEVREFIENNYCKELLSAFSVAEHNKIIVRTVTDGVLEKQQAQQYREIANAFRPKFPKCASIYDMLADDYDYQSDSEIEKARYED